MRSDHPDGVAATELLTSP